MLNADALVDALASADEALRAKQLERAESLYAKATVLAEQLYGQKSAVVASVLLNLSEVYEYRGERARAQFLLARVREIASNHSRSNAAYSS